MADTPPDAFLSYTRFDDRHDGGKISEFRLRLADAVRAVTGAPFEIFQDTDDIDIGERWSETLDEMLVSVRFFIPMLTPSYFQSKACRDELEKFLTAEERAGRTDLILPIYYIRCPVLEEEDQRRADHLASTIHGRQRWDWRDLRHHSLRNRKVRLQIEALAQAIGRARRTRGERATAPPTANRRRTPPEAIQVGPGFRDVDAPWCPEMVEVPAGEFMMGSADGDTKAYAGEKPQHLVRIGYRFAIGRYPMTFEEFDRFAAATKWEPPGDRGWGRGRRPVINVSWNDAKAYVEWLTQETGQPYRLPSEAEWEYACRAGTTTRYWWGDGITAENANFEGIVRQTSEVGAYPANRWGLCDMHGNVWEWVEDRWHDNYAGAPNDGTAWTEGKHSRRVLRGGAWNYIPGDLRAASRLRVEPDVRGNNLGFRVARTLTLET